MSQTKSVVAEKKINANKKARKDYAQILSDLKEGEQITICIKKGKWTAKGKGIICKIYPTFFTVKSENYIITINNYEILTKKVKILRLSPPATVAC